MPLPVGSYKWGIPATIGHRNQDLEAETTKVAEVASNSAASASFLRWNRASIVLAGESGE
jgi:hypothetical protein